MLTFWPPRKPCGLTTVLAAPLVPRRGADRSADWPFCRLPHLTSRGARPPCAGNRDRGLVLWQVTPVKSRAPSPHAGSALGLSWASERGTAAAHPESETPHPQPSPCGGVRKAPSSPMSAQSGGWRTTPSSRKISNSGRPVEAFTAQDGVLWDLQGPAPRPRSKAGRRAPANRLLPVPGWVGF